MAATKTLTAVGSHGYHTFTMTVTETAVNTSANTSTCTIKFTIKPKVSGYNWEDYSTSSSNCPHGTVSFNGSSWSWAKGDYDGKSTVTLVSKTVTVTHNTSGEAKNLAMSFSCSSGSDYYLPGSASSSGTITLTKIDRYPTVTQTLSSKTETSITMTWKSDLTCDRVRYRYSTDSGSTWTSWTSKTVSAKTGSYTLSSLTANTTYTIQTELRSSESGLTTTSSNTSVKTYNWPYATINDFNLKDNTTITITNPLDRECFLNVFAEGTSVERWEGAYTAPIQSYAIEDMLELIPNSMTGSWYCTVTYDGHTTTTATKTYSAAGYMPSITSVSYVDSNSTAQAIIQDPSVILQNISTPQFTVSGTAQGGATIVSATVVILGTAATGTATDGTAVVNCGTVNSATNVTAQVSITDSRGASLITNTTIVTMLAYEQPSAIITLQRQNNYYSETDLTVDASVMNTGSNVPTITARYKESSGSTWTNWSALQDNVRSTEVLDNTKEWDVEVTVTDSFGGSKTYTGLYVGIGLPIMFIDRAKRSVSINSFPTDDNQFVVNGVDILKQLFYEAGDTTTVDDVELAGLVTSSNKQAMFSVYVDKSMANITNITVTECKGGIRVPAGGYMNGVGDSGDWLSQSDVTVTAEKTGDHYVRLRLTSTVAYTNTSNNMPLVFNANPLTLEFS